MVIRTGDALFRTGTDSKIEEWNAECERLTGISRADAEGRYCWEVIAGRDADGGTVCHPGCSTARLVSQHWPVRCNEVHLRTPLGPKRLTISTIVIQDGDETTVLHPLRETVPAPAAKRNRAEPRARLTGRQTEILALLADGLLVKQIAARLQLSEATVRNHVRGILRELGAHSQLEAVARARRLALVRADPAA